MGDASPRLVSPRLIYCGMFGALSRVPLMAVLDAGYDVRAVVVPATEAAPPSARRLLPPTGWSARPASFAALLSRTIVDEAWARDIPVLAIGRFDRAAVDALAAFAPELLAVSCFPLRFPAPLLALPTRGVLNLHPALLPRGRGPDPLFWAFREAEPERAGQGGVTVHLMARELDAGPIVTQGRLELSDGMRESELELRVAALGAELLVRAIRALADGTARPLPQDERQATAYPLPGPADFVVTPERSARWAFNFLRGIAGRGRPLRVVVAGRAWRVRAALGYEPTRRLAVPFVEESAGDGAGGGSTLLVRCEPGVLRLSGDAEEGDHCS